jgi:Fe-S oxidoreductase
MATRDEADTTRARANILRHVLTNPTDNAQPFNNEQINQVMDLCMSCKGCKRECPSNVDMAKLKAEFLQGYYDANGVPRSASQIASFSKYMNWASRAPWLYNWLISSRLTSQVIKKIAGFSTKRSLPRLHAKTLRSWFDTRQAHSNAGSRGSVFLFCDEFTNYHDTSIGIAAIELLENLGFAVNIPAHEESGRSAISKGLLRRAKEIAEANVRFLSPIVNEQMPLVGIEPSAILGFRDEYPSLVAPELRDTAAGLAENCLLLDEFIAQAIDEDLINSSSFCGANQTIRLHGHCHQKALASLAPTVRMLQLPKNYSVRLIPSGCCGMAGSFGYEQEHYDLSMKIGELVLFPTVRDEASDSLIAATGTSCRHQILDGTGRRAYHPVEILRQALVEG